MIAPFLTPWILAAAVMLEMIFCKPYRIMHPVIFIGKGLDALEKRARRWHEHGMLGIGRFRLRMGLGTAGKLCLFVAVFCAANVVYWLCSLPLLGTICAMLFSAMGLALGNLLYEAQRALNAIENGSLDEGRHAVSMLVSRDTSALEEDDLRRALAETVSENFNDGFVAPLFWLTLGGPVGLWIYKCVSTIDSMWGYRTEKYEEFGKAAAKLDDILAWIPARLSAALLCITAPFVFRFAPPSMWSKIVADAKTMESPNAGWPMAAAAWIHGAYMGGIACYFGVLKHKPVLGPKDIEAKWDYGRLTKLLRHVRYAGIVAAVFAFVIVVFLYSI